jgi:hypothetical protein
MKIEFAYNYAQISGFAKLAITYDNYEEKIASNYLKINTEIIPLEFDLNYLKDNNIVYFGLNTYFFSHLNNQFSITIELLSNSKIINKIEIICSNDHSISDLISEKIKNFGPLVGLPIDSKIFSGLNRDIFPSPYLNSEIESDYNVNGFLHIRDFYNHDFMDAVAGELDLYCSQNYSGYAEGSSMRIEHLHTLGGKFTELFKDLKIRKELKNLYGVEMLPCQSLAYKYGSQQSVHSDYIHLTPYPKNLMCGVWVALEDVVEDSGELVVYPGSHKEKSYLRRHLNLELVRNNDYSVFGEELDTNWKINSIKYTQQKALLKKGDILIWDANLLHEGSLRKIINITRRSVVFHFFGKGAICYYDSTGDIGFAGEVKV